jgi:hypothetical protein
MRTVRAVVSHGATWLGAIAPFRADSPWWADAEPVSRHLSERLGTPVTVLRLLDVLGGSSPAGGLATYHVEVGTPPALDPGWLEVDAAELEVIAADEPLRAAYAKPGGPASDLRWADAALADLGWSRTGTATQVKTWNLSCVHRIQTDQGAAWLKVVNDWQTAESVVITSVAAIDPDFVHTLLAADAETGRTLVADAPGEDAWSPDQVAVEQAVTRWVAVQAALSAEEQRHRLLTGGVPNWSLDDMGGRLTAALVDAPGALPAEERSMLLRLLEQLPERLRALADAGLPDTLVHGDFQGGNWRSDGTNLRLMDWSDAAFSHPALDVVGLLAALPPERREPTLDLWARAWLSAVPGCDPYAAVALVQPLQPLQSGLLYQHFLDHIEPSERRYHEGDPAAMVRLAVERARTGD